MPDFFHHKEYPEAGRLAPGSKQAPDLWQSTERVGRQAIGNSLIYAGRWCFFMPSLRDSWGIGV